MTSPNVGKVSLKAAVETDDLRSQLTRAIQDEVMPQLKSFFDELQGINKEVDRLGSQDVFDQMAKDMADLNSETKDVAKATRQAGVAEEAWRTQVLRTKDAIRARSDARRQERKEIRETGAATVDTERRVEEAVERAAIAVQKRNRLREEWESRLQNIETARARSRSKFHAEVMAAIQDEIDGYRDLAKNIESESDAMISSALKRSKTERDEAEKTAKAIKDSAKKAADDQIREWLRAEKVFNETEDRKARTARAKLIQRQRDSSWNAMSNFGRQVGNVRMAAMPAMLLQAVQLASQLLVVVSQVSQVLWTVPAGFAAIGAAAGTLQLGFLGLEDAISAAFEKDPEKFIEALEKLSPTAANLARQIREIVPELKALQEATQDSLLSGVADVGRGLWDAYKPLIDQVTNGIADAFNDMFHLIANTLMTSEVQSLMQTIGNNIVTVFERLEPAMRPLTRALVILTEEGSRGLIRIADIVADLTIRFSNFIEEASRSGDLAMWIDTGVRALEMLVGWVEEFAAAWMDLATGNDNVMNDINEFVLALIDLLPDIVEFLANAGVALEAWTPVLEAINWLFDTAEDHGINLGEIFGMLLNPLKLIQMIVQNIVALLEKVFSFDLSEIPVIGDIYSFLVGDPDPRKVPRPREFGNNPILPPLTPEQQAKLDEANKWVEADNAARPSRRPGLAEGEIRLRDGTTVKLPAGPTSPDYQRPENLLEANAPSDSERRKAIEESITVEPVDPWAGINAPNVSNGMLDVNIAGGLPAGLGFPGGSFPGVRPSAPTALAGTDAGSIANYIAQSAMANGYTYQEALGFVAQALGESNLSASAYGATTGDATGGASGIFQFTPGTWADFGQGGDPLDPKANIDAYMRLAAARDPRSGSIRERLAAISVGGPAVPSNNAPWDDYLARAGNLVQPPNASVPTQPLPVTLSGYGGANNVSGLGTGQTSSQVEVLASLIGEMFPGVNLGGWRPSDGPNTPTGHQRGVALDIGIQDQAMGDAINQFIRDNAAALGVKSTIWRDQWKDFAGNQSTVGGHQDHVHVEVDPNAAQAIGEAVATNFGDNMYAANGPMTIDPTTGTPGYFQVDQQALVRAGQAVEAAGRDLTQANEKFLEAQEMFRQGLIDESELRDADWKRIEAEEKLRNEQADYAETQRGKFNEAESIDFDKLPFGHPAKILAGAIGGAGGSPEDIAALVGPMFGAAAGPLGQVAGEVATSAISALNLPTRAAPPASINALATERNPLTPFAMAGYDVPDYTVQGGGPEAQNLMTNQGPPGDASGRIFADTTALLDRSFTSLQAALEAKIDQLAAVMNQVKDQLGEQAIGPILESAVEGALQGAAAELGRTIGETAGPIIAQAVAAAIPESSGGGGNPGAGLVNTGFGAAQSAVLEGAAAVRKAGGGPITGGIPGVDSVPALLQRNEYVLDTSDVAMMGGVGGVDRWRSALKAGRVHKFATGGGVIGNDTVGADFFGVSQIPIIGTIVNLLIRVLLKIIGVEIEVRDTLDEMSDDFRSFRGDAFQAFEASGRLMNDTSALLDRTGTSEQAAADERLRILKIVIEGIIKFIIEKLIVPIGKAVANSLIQAGAGAASGAIGASFPGGSIVGNMVGNVITSAGSAAVDIGAEIFTDFALALTNVGVDAIGELFSGMFPNLFTTLFGGNFLALLADPITSLFTGMFGPILGVFSSLLGGLALPSFDDGGLATGKIGFMPKATIEPERVLSPAQTRNHERLTNILDQGVLDRLGQGGRKIEIHAPIYVQGGRDVGQAVQDRLMELI